MSKRRDLAAALLGASVATILWVTILSRDSTTSMAYSEPFHTFTSIVRNIQRGIRGNMLGNILLFVPFGFLLQIMWNSRMWKTIGIGTALSTFIEIAQLITHRGMFDLDDIILNTAGMAVGCAFFVTTEKIIRMMNVGQRELKKNKYEL